jgi:hypothetical protein
MPATCNLTILPQFVLDIIGLVITCGTRTFLYSVFPNGTTPSVADYNNIAPIYLNETFPENWYTHSTAFTTAQFAANIVSLIAASPQLVLPGVNQGVNNFAPINLNGLNLETLTSTQVLCLISTIILDLVPNLMAPIVVDGVNIIQAFLDGKSW